MSTHEMFYTVEKVTTEVTVFTAPMSWYTISVVSTKNKDHALVNEHVVETVIESSLHGSSPEELRMYADAAESVASDVDWGYLEEPSPAVEPAPLPADVPMVHELMTTIDPDAVLDAIEAPVPGSYQPGSPDDTDQGFPF